MKSRGVNEPVCGIGGEKTVAPTNYVRNGSEILGKIVGFVSTLFLVEKWLCVCVKGIYFQ